MIPFTRTVEELKKVVKIMEENGLERTKDFKLFLMAEIPSNIILADKFNEYVDGYSIGSNDLTMLMLGSDRNNGKMSSMFDERDLAIKGQLNTLLKLHTGMERSYQYAARHHHNTMRSSISLSGLA